MSELESLWKYSAEALFGNGICKHGVGRRECHTCTPCLCRIQRHSSGYIESFRRNPLCRRITHS